MNLLIKKAIIVCANSKYHLQVNDILIQNGTISKIAKSIPTPPKTKIIEGKQLHASIGWADIFANFGEPGFEHKETLASGALAAAKGGYTDVCVVPNTKPCIDNKSAVQFIVQQSKNMPCKIHPIGAVSQQTEGKNLAEMMDMQHHGAVAFSDGWHPIQNELLMLKALQYVKIFNGTIFQVPIHNNLTKYGLMHEGSISTALGLQGIIDIAEHIFINKEIELLRYSQSKLHITGVSTARGIQLIRAAKKEKLNITCSVTPYHLLYTHEALKTYNSIYKVNPPLRTDADCKALLTGIKDGTVDCIASHHQPHEWDAKSIELVEASYGMNTISTMLPLLLQIPNANIAIEKWIELLTTNPRNIANIKQPILAVGEKANITVFSTQQTTTVTENSIGSKSYNSPLMNTIVAGKIEATILSNHTTLNS